VHILVFVLVHKKTINDVKNIVKNLSFCVTHYEMNNDRRTRWSISYLSLPWRREVNVLVGVLVFNGTDHYMSAVQDTNRVWWFCNGTGVMRRQQNARNAFSTITKECPSQTLHPTHFFYAAVAN
jgi:hypothetical protein